MAGLIRATYLTAGETLTDDVSFDDVLTATHTVAYSFRWLSGSQTVDAVADGASAWTITVPAASTLRWDSGAVTFVAMATETATGIVTRVDAGTIQVVASPTAETYEMRVLAAVRALIEGRASDGQVTTGLEGLQLQHLTPEELLTWEREYAARVASQLRAAQAAEGTAPRRRVYTRFTRAT